ncbi:MAG: CDC27 family protein [Ferruginibacter sp.]
MNRIILSVVFLAATFLQPLFAQTPEQSQEKARSFMRQGDYANAVLILSRSLQQNPGNIELAKDLAQSYYFQNNYAQALEVIKPVLDYPNTDDQSYQIAGNIYRQLEQRKDLEKLYKKGLKRFPASGPLYNETGEFYFADKKYIDAAKYWEKGIQVDPSYSRNYYNAARYYFLTTDKVWSILYGEIFINMEPNGSKTTEMKQVLLNSYKKLYAPPRIPKNAYDKNNFIKSYLDVMNKQAGKAANGITPESLNAIRSGFITDWFATPNRPAFRLFEHQKQLVSEGLFEAYDQWLFGTVANADAYANWVKLHTSDNNNFLTFHKAKIFKVPAGQY